MSRQELEGQTVIEIVVIQILRSKVENDEGAYSSFVALGPSFKLELTTRSR